MTIQLFDTVFDARFCRLISRQAREALAKGDVFDASNQRWDKRVVEDSTEVKVHVIHGTAKEMILSMLRQRGILTEGPHQAMFFAGMPGSYIPWHNDGTHLAAATIYLNEEWREEWGGQFLYREKGSKEPITIVPRFNFGLRNDSQVVHRTLPVTDLAPEPRFSLQVFHTRE